MRKSVYYARFSKQGSQCQLVIGKTVFMSRMAAANHMMLELIWVLFVHLSSMLRLAKLMVAAGNPSHSMKDIIAAEAPSRGPSYIQC